MIIHMLDRGQPAPGVDTEALEIVMLSHHGGGTIFYVKIVEDTLYDELIRTYGWHTPRVRI